MSPYPEIRVERYNADDAADDPLVFNVTIREGGSATRHQVTVDGSTYRELTGGKFTPETLIETSFHYLLERERKESILSNFDLMLIRSFFPSYPSEIKDRLLRK